MKCKIPEISWHNRDPVLSVDIQPKTSTNTNYYRLASSGTDAHVLIWYMKLTSSGEYGDIELDLAADLARHQRAVNVVKWSPNGELLASGDDESVVFIWKQKSESELLNILDPTNEQDKEVWITLKVLRGHMEDIYDLSWSPNSLYLVTGSVDNSAIIWDVQKGKSMAILKDHKGFVQGVSWDPKNQYIATLSTDRYMRIFDIQTKKVLYRVSKSTLPVPEDNFLHGKRIRLYHDDTLQTFFRRLCFTPDGKLLLTPCGVTDYDGCSSPVNTTYAFSRYGFRQPAIVLPCPEQYTVAVKCCPLLYKLRPFNAEKNPPVVPLPYRMIFAVATKSSVYFYDTQQKQPFAVISNIHYTRLTDITWSNDGRIVVVSSTDGFCSLITFEQAELGEEYENSEAALEAALAQVTKKAKKQKDTDITAKSRKPSTEDTNPAVQKEALNAQKESQLEAVVEEHAEERLEDTKSNPVSAIETTAKSMEAGEDCEKSSYNSVDGKINKDEYAAEKVPNKLKDDSANVTELEYNAQPTPIAIKRKAGPTTELINNTIKEKSEPKATPIAIKRKPTSPRNHDAKNETSKKTTEATTPKSKKLDKVSPTFNKCIESSIIGAEESAHATTQYCNLEKLEDIDKPNLVKPENDEIKTSTISQCSNNTSEEKNVLNTTPIGIKHIAVSLTNTDKKRETSSKTAKETSPSKTPAIIANKVLATEIIIDKEILSSDEKFESPEKKSRPATPITIRRHPRTPNTTLLQTPTSMTNILKNQADCNNQYPISKEISTPHQDKRAKPIAVRRTPRAVISTPSAVNTTSLVDEAMDAWPIISDGNAEISKESFSESIKKPFTEAGITPLSVSESTCERTEDIRLVYEETNEETPAKESLPKPFDVEENNAEKVEEKSTAESAQSQTPNGNKTPRRVALKTISTPKSKKKLID